MNKINCQLADCHFVLQCGYVIRKANKQTCTNVDFVAKAGTERIHGWWKQGINVSHAADFELLRLPLNHLSVVQSQHTDILTPASQFTSLHSYNTV